MSFRSSLGLFEHRLAAIGAGTALTLMMLISVASVVGRYVLHTDLIPGAYNIIERVIFPLLVFWALPAAHRESLFPRLELLADSLPARGAAAVSVFVLLVELAIYAVLVWFVFWFAVDAIQTGRQMQVGTGFWPLWPVVIFVPFAFGLMVIEMLRVIWVDLRRLTGQADG
ncbi:C4-dicarboxylate ABC transporter substrate-binding protein (plasmid) [Sulfitobacter alexandrii]|uniref:TRAP transporter small permease protein n=1 Tax=Sulfitobacter alexandrii TaxID=1917485 RepID=A0A1J0WNP0_9RHOB|nr:TRAP transporter small permease [Sulfitobacter alexandrii]APE45993.1 C4-dicarboxylate ABC transporter substrate-binding protein [Sulfitobacter alexandrii]